MKRPAPFYGWYIVLACVLIIGASVGLFYNSLVVFVAPVPDSLGFSRGAFTFYTTVQAIATTIATPFYGYFFKKLGHRNVMLATAVICCAIQFGFSCSSHLWQFYTLAAIHGFFVVGIEIMSVGTLINNWFVEKRGIATGIAYTGSGIMAGIMVPLLTLAIERYGWQMGYRTIGLCSLALLLPLIIFVVRDRPEVIGLLPLGVQEDVCSELQERTPILSEGFTRRDALKSPVFWLFALATLCAAVITMGIALHSAAYLTDIGYSPGYASAVVSVFMFVTVAGKLIFGAVFDRLGLGVGAFLSGFVCLLSSVLLLFSNTACVPFTFALAFGFAYATQTVSLTLLTGCFFGNRDFGNIYGLIMMILMIGSAIGSPLPAFMFDITGSYQPAWILFAILSMIVTVSYVMAARLSKKLKRG